MKFVLNCIQLDLIAEPWSLKPDPVMETIQTLVSQGPQKMKEKRAASEEIDEIINQLKTVKKDNSRFVNRQTLL